MQELTTRFYNLLWKVSARRDKRPDWVEHERTVLMQAVNDERAQRGLTPISAADVRQGEQVGHPTYGQVLAEHCARLACLQSPGGVSSPEESKG